MAKAKRRREKGEKGKEVRKEKINRSEKSSRRIGNLG